MLGFGLDIENTVVRGKQKRALLSLHSNRECKHQISKKTQTMNKNYKSLRVGSATQKIKDSDGLKRS